MNKREKILAISTGVIICLGLVVRFMPEEGLSIPSVGGDDMANAHADFNRYQKTLDNELKIQNQYEALGMGVLDIPEG